VTLWAMQRMDSVRLFETRENFGEGFDSVRKTSRALKNHSGSSSKKQSPLYFCKSAGSTSSSFSYTSSSTARYCRVRIKNELISNAEGLELEEGRDVRRDDSQNENLFLGHIPMRIIRRSLLSKISGKEAGGGHEIGYESGYEENATAKGNTEEKNEGKERKDRQMMREGVKFDAGLAEKSRERKNKNESTRREDEEKQQHQKQQQKPATNGEEDAEGDYYDSIEDEMFDLPSDDSMFADHIQKILGKGKCLDDHNAIHSTNDGTRSNCAYNDSYFSMFWNWMGNAILSTIISLINFTLNNLVWPIFNLLTYIFSSLSSCVSTIILVILSAVFAGFGTPGYSFYSTHFATFATSSTNLLTYTSVFTSALTSSLTSSLTFFTSFLLVPIYSLLTSSILSLTFFGFIQASWPRVGQSLGTPWSITDSAHGKLKRRS
jgi:hypothetical protein